MSGEAAQQASEILTWQRLLDDAVMRRITTAAEQLEAADSAILFPRFETPDRCLITIVAADRAVAGQFHSPHRKDVPLRYQIRVEVPPRPVYVASSTGEITLPEGGTNWYEAFEESDGPCIYCIGEDKQLHPMEAPDGERLLSQVENSVPLTSFSNS